MLGYDDEGNEVNLSEPAARDAKQSGSSLADAKPERRASMDIAMSGMQRLIDDPDLRLAPEEAAGVMGSLWHESGGFRQLQEIKPIAGRGGFGWAQWTGPRRRQFEEFTKANNLDPRSDEANFQFLKHELINTPEGRVLAPLRRAKNEAEASDTFTNVFERPGVPALGSRRRNARKILAAWNGGPVSDAAPTDSGIGFTDDQVTFPEEPTTEEIRQSMPAQPAPTQPPTLLERGKGLLADVGQAITPPPVRNLMDEERARRAKPPELLKPNQSYLDLENNLQMNLNPQFVEQVKQAYEAATPVDRQRLIKQPGEVGQVAKYIDQQYQKAVGVTSLNPALDGIGGRREDIVQRNLGAGMEPQSAQIMADREVRFPGAMKPTGQAQSTTFDFDRFNRLKDAGPVTRGVEQGVDLLKSQAAGLNKMAADLGVVLGVPGASEYGRAQTKARGKLGMRQNEMGEAPTAFDRNLEGAIASTISNAPALVAGLFTGGEAIPLMGMGAQVAGDEYARGLEEGLTPQQSLARAVSFGAAEVLGEKIGFKGQLDLIKKATKGSWADFEKMFVKNLADQAIGEEFTTAAEARIDGSQVGLNKELTTRQLFDQMKDTLYQTVLQTTIMGAPGAMGAGARSLKKSDARNDQPYADAFKLIKDTPEAAAAYDQVINTRLGELRKDPEFRAIMENETDKSRKDAGLERGNQARQILAERRALRAKAPTLTDIQGAPAQGDLPEEDTAISSTGIPGDPNAQDPAGASTAPAEPTGTTQAPIQEGQSQAVNAAQGPQVTPDIAPEIRQVSDNEFQIVDTNTGTVISQHPTDVDAFEALDQLNASTPLSTGFDRETTTATQETTNEGQNQEANAGTSGQEGLLNIPGQAPGSIPMPAGGQVSAGTTEGINADQSAASADAFGATSQAGQPAPEGVGATLPPGAVTAGPAMATAAGVTPQDDQTAIQAPGVAPQTLLTGASNANDPTTGTGEIAPGTAAGSALAQGTEGGAGIGTVDGRDRPESGSAGGNVGATATAPTANNPVSEPALGQSLPDWWNALPDDQAKAALAAAGQDTHHAIVSGQASKAQWTDLPIPVRKSLKKWASKARPAASESIPVVVPTPAERGKFGPIFRQFYRNTRGAIQALLQHKNGDAIAALHHPDVGDIDLIWGDEGTGNSDGYGIAKIVKFHPEVLEDMQGVISSMSVKSRSSNRINLESPTHRAAVRLTWDNESKHWLMTAFEKERGGDDTRTDTVAVDSGDDTASSTPASDDRVVQTNQLGNPVAEGTESASSRFSAPGVMDGIADLVGQAGWAQKGGHLYRDANGKPNRTTWLPKQDWWMERPDKTTQKDFEETLRRLQSAEKLSPKHERIADFLYDLQTISLPTEDIQNTGYDDLDPALADEVDELIERAMRELGADTTNAIVSRASENAVGRSPTVYLLGVKYGIQEAFNQRQSGTSGATDEVVAGRPWQGNESGRQNSEESGRQDTQGADLFPEATAEDRARADQEALAEAQKEQQRKSNATQAPPADDGIFALDNRQDELKFSLRPDEQRRKITDLNTLIDRVNASRGEESTRSRVKIAEAADVPNARRIEMRLAGTIASLFNHNVIFVKSESGQELDFDGLVNPNDGSTIFIASDSVSPISRVLAHELLHALRTNSPRLYDNLVLSLRQVYDKNKVAAHLERRGYLKPEGSKELTDRMEEEWVADFVSDVLHSPDALVRVAFAMNRNKAGSGAKFLQRVQGLIERIKQGMAGFGQGSQKAIAKSDLKVAEDAVIEALAQYAAHQEKGTQPSGPLKFSNRTKAVKPAFSDSLVTLHNLTEENLAQASAIGGLPAPSLGITKASSPFTGFGEITLIGDKGLIDPEAGTPVFDRDAWTSRFPEFKFKKIKASKADALYERMKPARGMGDDGTTFTSDLFDRLRNDRNPSPDRVAEPFTRYLAPKMLYARDVLGKSIIIPTRDYSPISSVSADPDVLAFYKANEDAINGQRDTSKEEKQKARDELARLIGQAIDRIAAGKSRPDAHKEAMRLNFFSENGEISGRGLQALGRDAPKIGTKIEDKIRLTESIRKVVPDNDPTYLKWVKEQVSALFDEPTITLRGRQVPPTLDNLVAAMTTGATQGAEKSMTFGSGKASAHLGKQFQSIAEIQSARNQVVSEEVEADGRRLAQKVLENYQQHVVQFYDGKDYRGQIDTWAGLNDAMEALAKAGKLADTDGNIRLSLQKKGFRKVDAEAISLARQAIGALRDVSTNYFEAKPQRAVKLNEFSGAVAPKGLSPDSLDILKSNGLTVELYGKGEGAREKAIAKLSKSLEKTRGDVLFSNRPSRTIDVDGVQRPTTNAKDGLINGAEDGIRNFWRWSVAGMGRGRVESQSQKGQKYGRSQGVDEGDTARRYFFDADGRPNVYYHGTSDDIEAFQVGHPRRKDNGWLGRGIYVTSEPSVANSYTNLKRGTSSPNVMPLYIGLQNPYVADLSFKKMMSRLSDEGIVDVTNQLKSAGHDGVILEFGDGTQEIAVFDPSRIKSATGNSGAFDPENDSIIQEPLQDDLFRQQLDLFLDSDLAGQPGPKTEAARREAVAAVESLRRDSGSVLGARLADTYAARQRVSLVGHTLTSREDLATLAQVYRDTRFETFRLFFTNQEGKIVSQVGLTSRLPASSAVIVGTDVKQYMTDLAKAASKVGATHYYMLHNHPSTNPMPSEQDVRMTQLFDRELNLISNGHVVIDTNQFGFIKPSGDVEIIKKDFGQVSPYKTNEFSDTAILNPESLMEVAKKLEVDQDAVTLVVTTAQQKVLGVTTVPADTIRSGSRALRGLRIRKILKSMSGAKVFAVGTHRPTLLQLGHLVMDAIHINESGEYVSVNKIMSGAYGMADPFEIRGRQIPRVTADTSPEFDYLRDQTLMARGGGMGSALNISEPKFSNRPNPTFYSQLARGFESSKMNSMPGSQWRAWLFSNKAKLGIKDDEIAWTGIEDYLTLNAKEKLTKADIASYLADNGVQVEEVLKEDGDWVVYDGEDNQYFSSRAEAEAYAREIGVNITEDTVFRGTNRSGGYGTKFSSYTIPGGQNYRELLITLPALPNEFPLRVVESERGGYFHLERPDGTRQGASYETRQEAEELLNFYKENPDRLPPKYRDSRVVEQYKSSHWDEPNVLAHLRFDERTDADGGRVMFITELQSDWAQEGKKRGFDPAEKIEGLTTTNIPLGPFVTDTKSWLSLGLKRAIRYAAENGFDKIAFANGQQNADLYDLSKQVKSIAVPMVNSDGSRSVRIDPENGTAIKLMVDKNGVVDGVGASSEQFTGKTLDDVVGKEIADRILSTNEPTTFSGDGLKVGGEGMRTFYDQIVPQTANDVLKKLGGGRVGTVEFGVKGAQNKTGAEFIPENARVVHRSTNPDVFQVWAENSRGVDQMHGENFSTYPEAMQFIDAMSSSMSQPGFDITPALQDKALSGMPLFSNRRNVLNQPALATWATPDDSKLDNYVYLLQDKHIDTRRIVEKLGSRVSDAWDPYLKETLYHGRAAKDVDDFKVNEIKPLLQAMSTRGITIGELETFLHNRHAKEANEQIARINDAYPDGGSGIMTQDAQDYLNNLPAGKRTDLEAMAAQIDAITAGTRRLLVDSGLETQDTIDAWEATYADYVPLQRESEDVLSRGMGTGQGFSTKGPASKRRTGSGKNVVDIMANVMMQRERAITRAEKNKVGLALYGLAIQNPNPGFWYPVNPDAVKKPASVAQELVNNGMLESDLAGIIQEPTVASVNPRTGLVEYKINPALRNRDNVLAVRIKGKDRFLFFSTENERAVRMAASLKNLDAPEMHGLLNAFRMITRYVSSINTQYNPIFGVVNLLRDTQGAMLNLSTTPIAGKQADVAAKIAPAMAGIYGDLRADRKGQPRKPSQWSQLWEEFQTVGGKTGYRDMYATADDRMKALEKELKAIQEGKVKRLTRGLFDWLSDYNETLENAVRLSAYKVGTENGMTKEQAAVMAKELTVNFNRKGQIASQAGALYAFFNAAVQGTARLAETVKGPAGKKIVAGGLILGVVQAMIMAAAGYDDDEPPEFLRERNFIIPMPNGKYVSIPMPLGFHVLPNTGRVLTEIAINPDGAGKKIAGLLGSFFEAFNPIGSAGWSVQTIAPTFADPLVALSENRDSFGKEIAKKDRSATSPTPGFTRTKDTASWLSKRLAWGLNRITGGTDYTQGALSPTPDQLDYVFSQATGGVGREVMKIEQAASAWMTGEELPPYKYPLGVGRFVGDVKSQSAESNRFYANLTRLNELESEIKGRAKDGKDVAGFLRSNPLATLVPAGNQMERAVSELRSRKRKLIAQNAPKATIKALEGQIATQMKVLNDRVKAVAR